MIESVKGKRIYSIINQKCPVCHEGDFFFSKNPYNIPMLGKNHEECSSCGHKFEKEPGFFQGAMYVSYALTIGISLSIVTAIWILFNDPSALLYILTVSIALVLLMPLSYTSSRIIWMNLFASYKNDAIQNFKKRLEKN